MKRNQHATYQRLSRVLKKPEMLSRSGRMNDKLVARDSLSRSVKSTRKKLERTHRKKVRTGERQRQRNVEEKVKTPSELPVPEDTISTSYRLSLREIESENDSQLHLGRDAEIASSPRSADDLETSTKMNEDVQEKEKDNSLRVRKFYEQTGLQHVLDREKKFANGESMASKSEHGGGERGSRYKSKKTLHGTSAFKATGRNQNYRRIGPSIMYNAKYSMVEPKLTYAMKWRKPKQRKKNTRDRGDALMALSMQNRPHTAYPRLQRNKKNLSLSQNNSWWEERAQKARLSRTTGKMSAVFASTTNFRKSNIRKQSDIDQDFGDAMDKYERMYHIPSAMNMTSQVGREKTVRSRKPVAGLKQYVDVIYHTDKAREKVKPRTSKGLHRFERFSSRRSANTGRLGSRQQRDDEAYHKYYDVTNALEKTTSSRRQKCFVEFGKLTGRNNPKQKMERGMFDKPSEGRDGYEQAEKLIKPRSAFLSNFKKYVDREQGKKGCQRGAREVHDLDYEPEYTQTTKRPPSAPVFSKLAYRKSMARPLSYSPVAPDYHDTRSEKTSGRARTPNTTFRQSTSRKAHNSFMSRTQPVRDYNREYDIDSGSVLDTLGPRITGDPFMRSRLGRVDPKINSFSTNMPETCFIEPSYNLEHDARWQKIPHRKRGMKGQVNFDKMSSRTSGSNSHSKMQQDRYQRFLRRNVQ